MKETIVSSKRYPPTVRSVGAVDWPPMMTWTVLGTEQIGDIDEASYDPILRSGTFIYTSPRIHFFSGLDGSVPSGSWAIDFFDGNTWQTVSAGFSFLPDVMVTMAVQGGGYFSFDGEILFRIRCTAVPAGPFEMRLAIGALLWRTA